MKFSVPTFAALLGLAILPATAHAHYIWATVEKGQVRFALLESINEAPSAPFESYVAGLTPQSGGKSLTLGAAKNGARYAPLADGQNVVLVESIVGAKERGGEPYLLIYDAKGVATLAAAETPTSAPAELLAHRAGSELIVTVRKDGKPAPQTDVWVQWPGVEDPKSVATDARGEIHVPYPAASAQTVGGFVGIRAMVSEAKSGEMSGKRYASIHRWTTLTFPIAGAEAPKPFHTILRTAYGVNHEVVSNSEFNKTVFAGKLTKGQLIVHLQQRALVHNETHRILTQADAAHPVPYGPAQRHVLTLLFTDLIDMGSGWPTDADARPLTRAFLQEIRDSEKQGPYFALGVQHVYYGGITNGGRMIGAQIGDTLKITPAYYEKSDGYDAYLPEVDKITDPAARAEMIRGGQAAYRYIIASSNEDVFKAK